MSCNHRDTSSTRSATHSGVHGSQVLQLVHRLTLPYCTPEPCVAPPASCYSTTGNYTTQTKKRLRYRTQIKSRPDRILHNLKCAAKDGNGAAERKLRVPTGTDADGRPEHGPAAEEREVQRPLELVECLDATMRMNWFSDVVTRSVTC